MKVAVPKETAPNERRVALVPEVIGKLTKAGLEVLVESGAGAAASFLDDSYADAGARLVPLMGAGGEVHEHVVLAQRRAPVGLRVDVADAHHAGNAGRRGRTRIADDGDHLVPGGHEPRTGAAADEAVRAGDDDARHAGQAPRRA